jgi:type 1 glutamine amidotransferase
MSLDQGLDAARAAVDSVPDEKRAEDPAAIELAQRVLDEAKARYEVADSDLITPSMTKQLNEALTAMATQIQAQVAAVEASSGLSCAGRHMDNFASGFTD